MAGHEDADDAVDEQHDADVDDADGVDQDQERDDEHDDGHEDAEELRTRLSEAEAEARRWRRRAADADRALNKYKDEVKRQQKPRGDGDGGQKVPDDRVAELERQLAEKTAAANESRLRDEFYGNGKYDWQDRKVAYRLLEAGDVQDEDGVVDEQALADAVDKLAKDHPYLVKPKTPTAPRGDRPTGQQPGQGRRHEKPDIERLARKYGALRGRV